jgi:tetratricopeptide (TPR) repeat protein
MTRILCLISVLWISCTGYSQMSNQSAMRYFDIGSYKVNKKDYRGAIADFTEAIKLDSGFLQAYENRGVAKYYLQDFRGAIEDYDRALEINPDDYNTYGRRGWAKFSIEDCMGAVDDFTKAIEGVKNTPEYYNVRGQAKYCLQDYEGAIADFDWVIKVWFSEKEQKGIAFFWRGLVKMELGQRDSGCQDLIKAGKLGNEKALQVAEGFCK